MRPQTITYQYDLDGFLTEKVDGSDTTAYSYSSRGELLQVDLPDGNVITYDHDPLGRRIAKSINGAITGKYLWKSLTTLLAVYDSSDKPVSGQVSSGGNLFIPGFGRTLIS